MIKQNTAKHYTDYSGESHLSLTKTRLMLAKPRPLTVVVAGAGISVWLVISLAKLQDLTHTKNNTPSVSVHYMFLIAHVCIFCLISGVGFFLCSKKRQEGAAFVVFFNLIPILTRHLMSDRIGCYYPLVFVLFYSFVVYSSCIVCNLTSFVFMFWP